MKKRIIHIFVAGATALKNEREAISLAVNDINNTEVLSEDMFMNSTSYEHHGINQEEYNKIIKERIDLIIFILDGAIGKETEAEFKFASKLLKERRKPKIMVFLREYKEVTQEISYIRGLLGGTTNEYYTTYKDIEDLRKQAREKLNWYYKRQKKASKYLWVRKSVFRVLCLALLLALATIGLTRLYHPEQKPILVIMGGGSAVNFVERNKNINLKEYDEGYYVNMASGHAWKILSEDVITAQDEKGRRYYPVCLSAGQAHGENFLAAKDNKKLLDKGSIIEVFLGYDTLAVYCKQDQVFANANMRTEEISVSSLGSLLWKADTTKFNVFSTSDNSGTKNAYTQVLKAVNEKYDLSERQTILFSEESDLPTINMNNKPYLILGSTCYFVKELRNSVNEGKTSMLKLKDVHDNYITKPIYLYFFAYTFDNEKKSLVVPNQTLRLLKRLKVDFGRKLKSNMIRRDRDNIILNFDTLENWEE